VKRLAGHSIVKKDIEKNVAKLNEVLEKIENPELLESI